MTLRHRYIITTNENHGHCCCDSGGGPLDSCTNIISCIKLNGVFMLAKPFQYGWLAGCLSGTGTGKDDTLYITEAAA